MQSPSKHDRGFALIVVLTLMVLLSVLALGMLTLSSISLRQSSVNAAMDDARSNARMALMLAIGELQVHLGPDRRVNVNASQFSEDGGGSSAAAPGRGHWMGVYDSWDSTDSEIRPAPAFRKWLVSGDASDLSNADTAKAGSIGDLTLWEGSAADGSDRVSVPKVEVGGGAYAWWVGDENSKALIGELPEGLDRLEAAWSNSQSAPAAHHLNATLSEIARDSSGIGRLASLRSLDSLTENPRAAGQILHDFTTESLGVLADAARGGLKRDLTLFLDHPVSKPATPKLPNTDALYPNGITWEELWLYHNLWRELKDPVPGLASMTGGNLQGSKILMARPEAGPPSVSGIGNDPFGIYKLPSFIRNQWILSLLAVEKPAPEPAPDPPVPPTYDLHWVTDCLLTLWNPFDVPIALHPDAYISCKVWNIPYTIRLRDSSGEIAVSNFRTIIQQSSNGHNFTLVLGTAMDKHWGVHGTCDPVVLMPGEVLILSEGPGVGMPQQYSTASTAMGNKTIPLGMRAGWNLGKGFSFPVTLNTGKTITGGSRLRFQALANSALAWNPGLTVVVRNEFYWGPEDRGNAGAGKPIGHGVANRNVNLLDNSKADDHTDVFIPASGDLPAVPAMTGAGKYPILMFSHQMKTEDNPTSWALMSNVRNLNSTLTSLDGRELAASGDEVVVRGLAGNIDPNLPQLSTNQINRGIAGGSFTDHARGQDTIVTMSVPREAPLSLGAFQHAIANGFSLRYNQGAFSGEALRGFGNAKFPEISRAIGNSYAVPVIAPGETGSDHSYHVNRMLWDSWFLSGIAQQQSPHHAVKKNAREVYGDFLASPSVPLPGHRFLPWVEDPGEAIATLFASDGEKKPDAHELSSSALLCEGAFNVNSTSKEAWKAILASLDEAFIPVAEGTNEPASLAAVKADGVPVASLLSAFGSGSDATTAGFSAGQIGNGSNPVQWRGYRKLDHGEIDELAGALVTEIRSRGPFLSLADFINRRVVEGDTEKALRGPLQAALDKTVNRELFQTPSRIGTAPANANYPFPEAAMLPKSLNSPLHTLQADILTAIGPRLAARSDTFRIRTYGEARDRTGKTTATAWCEATVQRTPDYIDPSDPPEAADNTAGRDIPALVSDANKTLGRRFVVKSFRWLDKGELES